MEGYRLQHGQPGKSTQSDAELSRAVQGKPRRKGSLFVHSIGPGN